MRDARRWVVDACTSIGRTDLVECAELGVSELVTNALLHGETPFEVRVRGTREHPQVEVRDSSTKLPVLPVSPTQDEDDLLLTFGRGLSIVARCSDAWGAEIEPDGKTVWFAPATAFAVGEGVQGAIRGADSSPRVPDGPGEALTEVVVRGVPLSTYLNFQRHLRELRREARLLSLAPEGDLPLARSLSDLFGRLSRHLQVDLGMDPVELVSPTGEGVTDLWVPVPRTAAATIEELIELLEFADAFCHEERLLSLARTHEQQRFQRWFLGELVRQARGEQPLSWSDAAVIQGHGS